MRGHSWVAGHAELVLEKGRGDIFFKLAIHFLMFVWSKEKKGDDFGR